MVNSFNEDMVYKHGRHGTIKEYLATHNGIIASPLFRGNFPYNYLWLHDYLEPDESSIRVFNEEGTIEHYIVLSEYEIRGAEGIFWEGREGKQGIHHHKDVIFDGGPHWQPLFMKPWLRAEGVLKLKKGCLFDGFDLNQDWTELGPIMIKGRVSSPVYYALETHKGNAEQKLKRSKE